MRQLALAFLVCASIFLSFGCSSKDEKTEKSAEKTDGKANKAMQSAADEVDGK